MLGWRGCGPRPGGSTPLCRGDLHHPLTALLSTDISLQKLSGVRLVWPDCGGRRDTSLHTRRKERSWLEEVVKCDYFRVFIIMTFLTLSFVHIALWMGKFPSRCCDKQDLKMVSTLLHNKSVQKMKVNHTENSKEKNFVTIRSAFRFVPST